MIPWGHSHLPDKLYTFLDKQTLALTRQNLSNQNKP